VIGKLSQSLPFHASNGLEAAEHTANSWNGDRFFSLARHLLYFSA
jgi:hypothetical protein